jgi:hypothetical protein
VKRDPVVNACGNYDERTQEEKSRPNARSSIHRLYDECSGACGKEVQEHKGNEHEEEYLPQ